MNIDIPGVVVIDDFFPNFDRVRQHAILSEFYDWGYRDWETDRKSTRLNSSHSAKSRMPSSA